MASGKEIYFYADANTTHITEVSGEETFKFGNGQVEKHTPDGRKYITFPDETHKVMFPSGEVLDPPFSSATCPSIVCVCVCLCLCVCACLCVCVCVCTCMCVCVCVACFSLWCVPGDPKCTAHASGIPLQEHTHFPDGTSQRLLVNGDLVITNRDKSQVLFA